MSPSVRVFVAVLLALAPLPARADQGHQDEVVRIDIEELASPGVGVRSINNHGTIVGAISTVFASPSVPFLWTPARGIEFFLGDSPGQATDINDKGAIVGFLVDPSGNVLSGFLWTRLNGVVHLGSFLPAAINNRGQVAGDCFEVLGHPRPCLWEGGVVTELGNGALSGSAFDINARGDIAGQCASCGEGLDSAFVWSRRTGVAPLPSTRGGADAIAAAMAINHSGEVVGFETEAVATAVLTPVRWTPAGEIHTFPQFQGTFVAINARGLAVGRHLVQIAANQFAWHGFATTRDGYVLTLGPGIPVAVNDRGAILGTTEIEGVSHVVVWLVGPGKRFEP
jgi:uncharacterized membrane protein